jgi:hypothetical protein
MNAAEKTKELANKNIKIAQEKINTLYEASMACFDGEAQDAIYTQIDKWQKILDDNIDLVCVMDEKIFGFLVR